MTLEQWVSVFGTVIGFCGLLFVGLQFRQGNRQRESDSMVKLYDINRELLTLSFHFPQLLDLLEDKDIPDRRMQKRYLQMLLNQMEQFFSFSRNAMRDKELKESVERNLVDFLSMRTMQEHWKESGSFYTASFQRHVNAILNKKEPPRSAAPARHK